MMNCTKHYGSRRAKQVCPFKRMSPWYFGTYRYKSRQTPSNEMVEDGDDCASKVMLIPFLTFYHTTIHLHNLRFFLYSAGFILRRMKTELPRDRKTFFPSIETLSTSTASVHQASLGLRSYRVLPHRRGFEISVTLKAYCTRSAIFLRSGSVYCRRKSSQIRIKTRKV